MAFEGLRVALVHDWLTGMRGGEKVLECLAELFPQARLFTLLKTERMSPTIEALETTCSPAQRLPRLNRLYRHYLPLYPWAIGRLDLRGFDLVISSSHCVAKAAKADREALHISYIHTPMRYVWDLYPLYFGPGRHPLIRAVMPPIAAWLRSWDRQTCRRADHLVCNSRHVAERINRHWDREATVIHAPVDCSRFHSGPAGDYYLVVSALAPYKGVGLAVRAANSRGFKLVVAGDGQDRERLEKMAGPTVEFLGRVDDRYLPELYANCRAFIFPGEEDFGITPLEAMASGKPVIALGRGGALDSVVPVNPPPGGPLPSDSQPGSPPTGVFFYEETPEALIGAVESFEAEPGLFDPEKSRIRAERFDRAVFKQRFSHFAAEAWEKHTGPKKDESGFQGVRNV